jgi:hypothetical protein
MKSRPFFAIFPSALLAAGCITVTGCGAGVSSQAQAFAPANSAGLTAPSLTSAQQTVAALPINATRVDAPSDVVFKDSHGSIIEDVVLSQASVQRQPVALANGSQVSVEVTAPQATVVMVDTGLAIADLSPAGAGRWRGSFRYVDESNWGDARSNIKVRIASPLSSAEKVIAVTTVHDL